MKTLFRFLFLLVAISSLFILSGCNTMEGIGKDLKEAGGAIEDAAKN